MPTFTSHTRSRRSFTSKGRPNHGGRCNQQILPNCLFLRLVFAVASLLPTALFIVSPGGKSPQGPPSLFAKALLTSNPCLIRHKIIDKAGSIKMLSSRAPASTAIPIGISNSTEKDLATAEGMDLMSALPVLSESNMIIRSTGGEGLHKRLQQYHRQQMKNNDGKRKPSTTTTAQQRIPKTIPRLSDILEGKVKLESDKNTRDVSSLSKGRAPKMARQRSDPDDVTSTTKQQRSTTTPALPWRASYKSSRRTQGRIKKAFDTVFLQRDIPPCRRSLKVLNELLQTPPQYCNSVNLVCALTYSAKAMGLQHVHQNPDPELRKTLHQVLDILHDLVVVHRDERLLSPRQLCNACWAIAKHLDRDPGLLPVPARRVVQSSDMMILKGDTPQAWEWNSSPISDEEKSGNLAVDSPESRLQVTIDEIAMQLTSILLEDKRDESQEQSASYGDTVSMPTKSFHLPQIKIGEICMACWAYGKLRPRDTPPGWPGPPQVGKVTTASVDDGLEMQRRNDIPVMKFEQLKSRRRLDDDPQPHYYNEDESTQDSLTDNLFDAIGATLVRSLESFYGYKPPLKSGTLLEECTWSELANLGWAFASHGRCRSQESEMLLTSLAHEAAYRLEAAGTITNNNRQTLLVRDITQLLWSLGTLQADNFRLADGLVELVDALTTNLRLGTKTGATFAQGRPLRRWSCADLVQVAVSLAHARIDEQRLLRAIYEEGIHRLMEGSSSGNDSSPTLLENGNFDDNRRSFHPWEASILLWAQARLYLTCQHGMEYDEFADDAPTFFLKALQQNGGSFARARIGPQEQANIVWSLVVLEKYHSADAMKLIDLIFEEASRSCKEDRSIQLEHAHQLWQAYFMLEEDCPRAVKRVPEWFVTYLREKWSVEKSRDKLSSARHRSLSNTLQLMGVNHINEHDEDIDVAIILQPNAAWVHETEMSEGELHGGQDEKVSVAVEFDGPNHFTRLGPNDDTTARTQPRALGHTVLKYRLLKKQGWTVVRVPYYEFDKIPFWASMERQRYLQRKLKTHANIRFSQVDVSEYKALTPNRKSRFD